jgi:hypothetical protein
MASLRMGVCLSSQNIDMFIKEELKYIDYDIILYKVIKSCWDYCSIADLYGLCVLQESIEMLAR